MKAVVCTRYGSPEALELREVQKPAPKPDEVLVKIAATAATASDSIVRRSDVPLRTWLPMRLMVGLTRPRKSILGMVLAGTVEAVGRTVTRFQPGDAVFGFTGFSFGAYAEYACVRETESMRGVLAAKPANVSYEEAAALVYGGQLALHFLHAGQLKRSQKVLIYGASGAIGTLAVQIARAYGADVIGICGPSNLELVRSLGADPVYDYTAQTTLDAGLRFDLILDAVGKRKSSPLKEQCLSALAPGGKAISVDDGSPPLRIAHLDELRALAEAGQVRAVIDRIYPLAQMVEAHRYIDSGHKKGNVVITVP